MTIGLVFVLSVAPLQGSAPAWVEGTQPTGNANSPAEVVVVGATPGVVAAARPPFGSVV